jgi:enolase
MSVIKHVFAREILDSRGNPTVEVELSDGTHTVRACVPSGASTGIHEALELRDGDKARYGGKGVLKAVANVNDLIANEVIGMESEDQEALDQKMLALDGTENKSKLGANAILGVSLAVARLSAVAKGIPLFEHIQEIFAKVAGKNGEKTLPRPMMNILNGGSHADSGIAVQEFMVSPKFDEFSRNLQAGAEIFHALKKILSAKGLAVGVGDEGGFAPKIPTVVEALDVIMEAIETAGYKAGEEVELALDAAASEFLENGVYTVDGKGFNSEELCEFYQNLVNKYPIYSIEDSHGEDDFAGFAKMQELLGDKIQLVGDDLLVTNKKRLQMGIDQKLCNSILIKVNQIGSLTETFETIALAKVNGFTTVISHRSGETEDSFIADLAVGTNAGQIKTGSLSRSERICKYNQLLRISEKI